MSSTEQTDALTEDEARRLGMALLPPGLAPPDVLGQAIHGLLPASRAIVDRWAAEGTTPADAAIAYAVALGLVMGELSLSLARGDPEKAQIGLARIMDLAATMGVRATLHFTTVPATDAGEATDAGDMLESSTGPTDEGFIAVRKHVLFHLKFENSYKNCSNLRCTTKINN